MKFGMMTQIGPRQGHAVKISNLKKQDGGGRHLEKPHKSRYHNKGLTDLREIWHGLLSAQTVKKYNFQNPRWRMAGPTL